jgi:hypothetical protein
MPAGTLIVLIIVCTIVVAAAAVMAVLEVRQALLRRQFGTEYDRLARQNGHRQARAELMARKRRVAVLGIRPLSADQHDRYTSEWARMQESFVEDPAGAVASAAALVRQAAADRGYRTEDRGQIVADLSVSHARRLDAYRRAEETAEQVSTASTEDLRQAMLWYRAMFRDLAGAPDGKRPRQPPGGSQPPLSRVPSPRLPRSGLRVPQPRIARPQVPGLSRLRAHRSPRSPGQEHQGTQQGTSA